MNRWIYGLAVALALAGAYWLGSQRGGAGPEAGTPAADSPSVESGARAVEGAGRASRADQAQPVLTADPTQDAPLMAGPVAATTAPRPIAGSFMTQGFLNPHASASVEADDFGKLIAQARREADAEALRATDAYRRILATGLADLPGEPRVDDIACTGRVCLLAVSRRPVERSAVDWMAILGEPTGDTALKVGALVDGDKALPGGRIETRVVFAMGSSGFIVGPPRP